MLEHSQAKLEVLENGFERSDSSLTAEEAHKKHMSDHELDDVPARVRELRVKVKVRVQLRVQECRLPVLTAQP